MDVVERPWVVKWRDVTKDFLNHSSKVPVGDLVHSDHFTLFEAMSAIELMDPKMDAGLVRQKRSVDFASAVNSGLVPTNDIPVEDMLTILDGSFALMVMWLEGNSSVQTVFTNLYLHDVGAVNDPVLKPVLIGFVRLLVLIKTAITNAAVYEEEDFQTCMYSFDTFDGLLSWVKVDSMLKTCHNELKKRRNCTEDQAHSLSARILLLRQLINALTILVFPDASNPKLPMGCAQFLESEKLLQSCKQLLEKQILPSCSKATQSDPTYGLQAFEPAVNQKLLPPTFPRRPQVLTIVEGFNYLNSLTDRILYIVRHLPANATCISSTWDMMRDFGRRSSCCLTRSLLQVSYGVPIYACQLTGKVVVLDCVKDSILQFVPGPTLCSPEDEPFVSDVCKVVVSLLQVAGHNRARQREKLVHVLEDFAYLQEHMVHSPLIQYAPFVNYHVLKTMHDYLLLGFELQLYSPHEFAYVYWYLSEVVYRLLANLLNKAADTTTRLDHAKGAKCERNGKKQTKNKRKADQVLHRVEGMHWHTLHKICHAYFLLMLGLRQLDKVRMPSSCDAHWQRATRFQHRMSAFASLSTPSPVHYRQYLEMSRVDDMRNSLNPSHVLTEAAEVLEESAANLTSTCLYDHQQVASLAQICKHNAVAVRILARGHKREGFVELDFSRSQYFPTIKL